MKRIFLVCLIVTLISITACQGNETKTLEQSNVPEQTVAVLPDAMVVLEEAPAPTATAEVEPTETLEGTESTPTAVPTPTPTAIPDCDRYNTGDVVIENHSLNSSYDVVLDGMYIGNILPGQSMVKTINAIIKYTLQFKYSGSEELACSEVQLSAVECSRQTVWCNADPTPTAMPTPTPPPTQVAPPVLLNVTWSDINDNDSMDAGDQLAFIFSKPMDISTLNTMTTINVRLGGSSNLFGSTGATSSWGADQTTITVTLGADCDTNIAGRCFNPSSDVKDQANIPDATVDCVPASE